MTISQKTETITFSKAAKDVTEPRRLLGVQLDTMLSFRAQVQNVVKTVQNRINQLRAFSARNRGTSTFHLRTFYKGYVEPVLLYAIDTYWVHLSKSNRKRLAVAQRHALRVVTGLVHSTDSGTLSVVLPTFLPMYP